MALHPLEFEEHNDGRRKLVNTEEEQENHVALLGAVFASARKTTRF
jgi:hypothetical protein